MRYQFDFVKHRKKFFIIFAVIFMLAAASLATRSLKLGVEFVHGTRIDMKLEQKVALNEARDTLRQLGHSEGTTLRQAGDGDKQLIFRTPHSLEAGEVEKIRQAFADRFKQQVQEQTSRVDPIVGRELAKNALLAVAIASLGIIAYLSFRFEYRFAVAAILSLFCNAFFVTGFFSWFQIEVSTVFILAILTIIGYDVNDTIVIFDRIRENLQRHPPRTWNDLAGLVNESIHQTLIRSINTVLTVVFAAGALYFAGSESIQGLALALLVGLFTGTCTSIFLASQVWVGWRWRSLRKSQALRDVKA